MTKTQEHATRKEICDLVDGFKKEKLRSDAAVKKLKTRITAEQEEGEKKEAEIRKLFAKLNVAPETEEVFHGEKQKMQLGKGKLITELATSRRLFKAMGKVGKAWACMKFNVGDLKKELPGTEYEKIATETRDGAKRKITFPE